jgi:hypothetical protein
MRIIVYCKNRTEYDELRKQLEDENIEYHATRQTNMEEYRSINGYMPEGMTEEEFNGPDDLEYRYEQEFTETEKFIVEFRYNGKLI